MAETPVIESDIQSSTRRLRYAFPPIRLDTSVARRDQQQSMTAQPWPRLNAWGFFFQRLLVTTRPSLLRGLIE
jgi:hypothetical protein